MKLLTLNIWGGHVTLPLLKFIKDHQYIDIFCFQEVYKKAPYKFSTDDKEAHLDIFSDIEDSLPKHKGFFKPVIEDWYGIGIFIKQNISILEEGHIYIHENPSYSGRGPTHSRILQWAKCRSNQKIYTIMNMHGLWNGKGKKDSPDRIKQFQKIRNFMDSTPTPKILCGDFNLRPDTKSMQLLNQGMHNLIQTHSITSTRTNLYPKEEKFADYILTSPEIIIRDFRILPHEVSDHAPLLLEFDFLKQAVFSD